MSTSLPEGHASTPERRAEVFVTASIEGRVHEAQSILHAMPDIARYSLEAAAVLGDSDHVSERLATAARRRGQPGHQQRSQTAIPLWVSHLMPATASASSRCTPPPTPETPIRSVC